MEEDGIVEEAPTQGEPVGARLKEARIKAGYELEQVAAETRIPQRHLVAIEAGEFSQLPSRTYAIGFTRTYARMLGLNEHETVDAVREELASGDPRAAAATAKFEPGDPARVPGRGLAWFGVLAAILFGAGVFTFYRSYFDPSIDAPPLVDENAQQAKVAAAPKVVPSAAPVANGPVVFTANMDGTWVKFYDAKGQRLFEAQMAKGDSFTIPADADGPQVWTGRPYALDITVGGRAVPRLADDDRVIKDVPVSAAALLARAQPTAVPGAAGAPIATGSTANPAVPVAAAVAAEGAVR